MKRSFVTLLVLSFISSAYAQSDCKREKKPEHLLRVSFGNLVYSRVDINPRYESYPLISESKATWSWRADVNYTYFLKSGFGVGVGFNMSGLSHKVVTWDEYFRRANGVSDWTIADYKGFVANIYANISYRVYANKKLAFLFNTYPNVCIIPSKEYVVDQVAKELEPDKIQAVRSTVNQNPEKKVGFSWGFKIGTRYEVSKRTSLGLSVFTEVPIVKNLNQGSLSVLPYSLRDVKTYNTPYTPALGVSFDVCFSLK